MGAVFSEQGLTNLVIQWVPHGPDFWGPGGYFDTVERVGHATILVNSTLAIVLCALTLGNTHLAYLLGALNVGVYSLIARRLGRISSYISGPMLHHSLQYTLLQLILIGLHFHGSLTRPWAIGLLTGVPIVALLRNFIHSIAGP